MSRSKSRSHGKRKPTAYNRFVKQHMPACRRDALKKTSDPQKASRMAMAKCAEMYRRSHSKSRSRK
jgi:hypothetical protein